MTIHPAVIHRYQVLEPIGQGGMGAVYLARDPALDRLVAIKLLRDDLDNSVLRDRFLREARAAASLSHVNIVAVFDVGEHEGQPFIAMEYIKGETVRELLDRRAELALVARLQLMKDLCAGLAHAHRLGVIHRDIKPGNLIVTGEQSLKILDFGIARIRDSSMTQVGALMGTVNYMSPEQSFGLTVDHRADVFAVGAVFYELLSYRKAFPGRIQDGVLHRIQFEAPAPLEQVVPGLDAGIIRIVAKALEKEKARRYDDLSVMRRDIIKVLKDIEERGGDDSTRILAAALPAAASGPNPTPTPGRAGDRAIFARRRAAEIEHRLQGARIALEAGDYEGAIAACEEALFLDPDNVEADTLRERARSEAIAVEVQRLIADAHGEIERGSLTSAEGLLARIEELAPDGDEALAVRNEIEQERHQRELARQRQAAVQEALARAESALDEERLEDAVAAADEVLALDAASAPASAIRQRAAERLEEARRREEHDRAARATIASASERFEAGEHAEAVAALAAFRPPHDLVAQALLDLSTRARQIEEDRRRAERERAERSRRVAAFADGARAAIADGRFEDALAIVEELKRIDGDAPEARALAAQAVEAREALRAREAHDRAAEAAVEGARRRFDAGDYGPALAALAAFRPPHDLVAQAALDLADRLKGIEAEQRVADQQRARRERELSEEARRREEDARREREEAHRRQEESRREHEEARRREEEVRRHEDEARRRESDRLATEQNRVERERRLLAWATAARTAVADGRFDEAREAVERIRGIDPGAAEIEALTGQIEQALAVRRRREEHDRAALETADAARERFRSGDRAGAIAMLAGFRPPHDLVAGVLLELGHEAQQIDEADRRATREKAEAERQLLACTVTATSAIAGGRFDEALELVRQIRQIDPGGRHADTLVARIEAEKARLRKLEEATLDVAPPEPLVASSPDAPPTAVSSIEPVVAAPARFQDVTLLTAVEDPLAGESLSPELLTGPAAGANTTRRAALAAGVVAAAAALLLVAWWMTSRPAPVAQQAAPGGAATTTGAPSDRGEPGPGQGDARQPGRTPGGGTPPSRIGAPGTTSPARGGGSRDAAAEASLALQQLAAGEREAALATIAKGLERYPNDSRLREALDGMRTRAAQEAFAARQGADAASANGSARFREAGELLAGPATRPGPDAVRAYWDARRLFDEAAAAATATTAVSRAIPAAGAPVRPGAPPPAATSTPAPAPGAERPATESARLLTPEDDQAIRELLLTWKTLMEGTSTAALKKLQDNLTPAQISGLENLFINYPVRKVQLEVLVISTTTREAATVRCRVVRRMYPANPAQAPREVPEIVNFRVERRNGWRIVDMKGLYDYR